MEKGNTNSMEMGNINSMEMGNTDSMEMGNINSMEKGGNEFTGKRGLPWSYLSIVFLSSYAILAELTLPLLALLFDKPRPEKEIFIDLIHCFLKISKKKKHFEIKDFLFIFVPFFLPGKFNFLPKPSWECGTFNRFHVQVGDTVFFSYSSILYEHNAQKYKNLDKKSKKF